MAAGAKPSEEDAEGNTPLHVKCYGEVGKLSEIDAIKLLLESDAKITVKNHRVSSQRVCGTRFSILKTNCKTMSFS